MLLYFFLVCFCLFAKAADATALTYKFEAYEFPCFFVWNDTPGKKVGFYFAVQQGGSFDVDFNVLGPKRQSILSGNQERQGDYVFTANEPGEYAFCFSNEMSTLTDKLIDFEILLEHEVRPEFKKDAFGKEQPTLTEIEETIFRLSSDLTKIARTQRHFRTRENRNAATVASTKSRLFWFSVLESLAIISMAAIQIFIIKSFFNVKKGGV
ncbi:hypothetical protein RMATCC62417_12893 [Rhizopus microsporus]|nr:hypothetical protein RMATCC62417_12893 [Rhizopus microsporus]